MSLVLLDTNVISELAKPEPNPSVVDFCKELPTAYLSVITMHELLYGALILKAKSKGKKLQGWIDGLEQNFAGNILPITTDIAKIAADMRATAARSGKVVPSEDALIAATAKHHGLRLATRNTKDFKPTKIPVINPWEV